MARFDDFPDELVLKILFWMHPMDILLKMQVVNQAAYRCIRNNQEYLARNILRHRYACIQRLCRLPRRLDAVIHELIARLPPMSASEKRQAQISLLARLLSSDKPNSKRETWIERAIDRLDSPYGNCECPACRLDLFHWLLLSERGPPMFRRLADHLGTSSPRLNRVIEFLAKNPLSYAGLVSVMSDFFVRQFGTSEQAETEGFRVEDLWMRRWTRRQWMRAGQYDRAAASAWPPTLYCLKHELDRISREKTHEELVEEAHDWLKRISPDQTSTETSSWEAFTPSEVYQ